ncbi:MFS transporter [Kitasatospora sp. NPDC058965]|uniref:MFS transporter n=1 Tax=Kitasatospora sp. NPDC058965 TaxID=3346682 RepID=UPI0036CD0A6E
MTGWWRGLPGRLLPAPGAPRLLAGVWLVNTIGSGLYLPAGALFFTRVDHLATRQVALGLSAAGLVALLGAVPLGRLADRHGARRAYLGLLLVQAVGMAGFTLVRSFPAFVAAAALVALADQGAGAARAALIASVATGGDRVRLRARLRSVTNVGITLGALGAGVALQLDTPAAYRALVLGNAATFLGAALVLRALPRGPARPRSAAAAGGSRLAVLRDGRFALVTGLCAVLSLQNDLLTFVLPLWVAGHTAAPRALVPALLVVNTVLVVCCQVAVSRGAERTPGAARLCRRAGLLLLAGCLAAPFSGATPGWAAAGLLVLFVLLVTLGELATSAGSFGLSFTLAPEHALGEYQGFFALGRGAARALAPTLLGLLCLGGHAWGWAGLGLLFAATGALLPVLLDRRTVSTATGPARPC